jgi:hypothetical protein
MEQLKHLQKFGLSLKQMESTFLTLKLFLANLESQPHGSLQVMNMLEFMMCQFMTALTMSGLTESRTLHHPQLSLNEPNNMIRIKQINEP